MKHLLITLFLVILCNKAYQQNYRDSIAIKELLSTELKMVDEIFNNEFSLSENNESAFSLKKIQKLEKVNNVEALMTLIDVYSVSIDYFHNSSQLSIINNGSNSSQLDFYIIKYLNKYYKLFGFYFSDIRSADNELKAKLGDVLYAFDLLKKQKAYLYQKEIITDNVQSLSYKKYGYASGLLKLYYSHDTNKYNCFQTIILPGRPFSGTTK